MSVTFAEEIHQALSILCVSQLSWDGIKIKLVEHTSGSYLKCGRFIETARNALFICVINRGQNFSFSYRTTTIQSFAMLKIVESVVIDGRTNISLQDYSAVNETIQIDLQIRNKMQGAFADVVLGPTWLKQCSFVLFEAENIAYLFA